MSLKFYLPGLPSFTRASTCIPATPRPPDQSNIVMVSGRQCLACRLFRAGLLVLPALWACCFFACLLFHLGYPTNATPKNAAIPAATAPMIETAGPTANPFLPASRSLLGCVSNIAAGGSFGQGLDSS